METFYVQNWSLLLDLKLLLKTPLRVMRGAGAW
jgi:lipopolysaccharide/colanic/teichoic acid biosynthesis glycosyltransferase